MRLYVPSLGFAAFLLATFGVLSGTSCWAVIVAFATLAVVLGAIASTRSHGEMIRSYRENRRCLGCGYDLTGNVSGVCPECGSGVARG